MWPVVFNPSAARSSTAPPPHVLKGIQKSVEPRAAYYLALAREIAKDARKSGRGRGVGAVVVDKDIETIIDSKAWEEGYDSRQRWMHAVVAVAGDCRFARPEAGGLSQAEIHTKAGTNSAAKPYDSDLEGGPELHALMRAVELVAKSRREDPEHQASLAAKGRLDVPAYDPQCSNQLSEFEKYFLYEAANHVMNDDSTSFAPSTIPSPNSLSPRKRKCEDVNPESIMETIQPDEASKMPSPPLPAPPPLATALMDPANLQRLTLSTPRIRNRSQGGYLCTDMDIYLSHEPCLCCSMGMLLSRFRAVVFPRKGRMITGGLASEPVISPVPVDENAESENADKNQNQDPDRPYYGLHWRKQLNWRAMCFEFIEDDYPPLVGGGEGEEVDVDVDDDEEGVDVDDDVTFHA